MDFEIGRTGAFWAALRFACPHEGGEYPPKELRCPACWKRDAAASLPRGFLDNWMSRHHRYPYECRVCGKRFYHFEDKPTAEKGH